MFNNCCNLNLHEILETSKLQIVLDPFTCGFAKVVTFEYLTRNLVKNQNVVQNKNA